MLCSWFSGAVVAFQQRLSLPSKIQFGLENTFFKPLPMKISQMFSRCESWNSYIDAYCFCKSFEGLYLLWGLCWTLKYLLCGHCLVILVFKQGNFGGVISLLQKSFEPIEQKFWRCPYYSTKYYNHLLQTVCKCYIISCIVNHVSFFGKNSWNVIWEELVCNLPVFANWDSKRNCLVSIQKNFGWSVRIILFTTD